MRDRDGQTEGIVEEDTKREKRERERERKTRKKY